MDFAPFATDSAGSWLPQGGRLRCAIANPASPPVESEDEDAWTGRSSSAATQGSQAPARPPEPREDEQQRDFLSALAGVVGAQTLFAQFHPGAAPAEGARVDFREEVRGVPEAWVTEAHMQQLVSMGCCGQPPAPRVQRALGLGSACGQCGVCAKLKHAELLW
jgi:hypothetical protein